MNHTNKAVTSSSSAPSGITQVGEDILCDMLPEPMIGHIFSFLPTKDAYRISILSKRWKNHWTSLTKLSVHQHSSPSFVKFVNQVLTQSNSIYEELEELELVTNSVNVPISTDYTSFKKLTVLKLCGINFETDKDSKVWLTFPLLTKFESKNCAWFFQATYVCIYAPQLQTISIQHDIDMPCHYYYNTYPRSGINFSCSELHLKEFSYCSFIPREVSLPSPCHASAKIILHEIRESYNMRNYNLINFDAFAFRLLCKFRCAKSIKFELAMTRYIRRQPEELCEFPMLTHLEVGLVSVDILLTLLQKTPVLKTLVLKGIHKFAEELLSSVDVPGCLASLHVVKFEEVNGDDHELFLAKFFRENGMILERMCFSVASKIKYEVMEEFKEKLFAFCNFTSVEVEFSYD